MKHGRWEVLLQRIDRLGGELETVEKQIQRIWINLGQPFASHRPQSVNIPSAEWGWIAWGVITVCDVFNDRGSSALEELKSKILSLVVAIGKRPPWLDSGAMDYSLWVHDNLKSIDLSANKADDTTLMRLASGDERPRSVVLDATQSVQRQDQVSNPPPPSQYQAVITRQQDTTPSFQNQPQQDTTSFQNKPQQDTTTSFQNQSVIPQQQAPLPSSNDPAARVRITPGDFRKSVDPGAKANTPVSHPVNTPPNQNPQGKRPETPHPSKGSQTVSPALKDHSTASKSKNALAKSDPTAPKLPATPKSPESHKANSQTPIPSATPHAAAHTPIPPATPHAAAHTSITPAKPHTAQHTPIPAPKPHTAPHTPIPAPKPHTAPHTPIPAAKPLAKPVVKRTSISPARATKKKK